MKDMGYESESHFGRYIGRMQWLFPYIGWDFRKRTIDPMEKNLFGQSLAPGKNLFGQNNTKNRSEHTSELKSLMRISYAVFCLKKTITTLINTNNNKYHDN